MQTFQDALKQYAKRKDKDLRKLMRYAQMLSLIHILFAVDGFQKQALLRNYIALTQLVPELQQMVDEKKIGLSPAYQIAALRCV